MAQQAADQIRPRMTVAQLLELPTVVDLATANRALGLGRTHGYRLARRGDYPVPVLRDGRAYRVSSAAVALQLGLVLPARPEPSARRSSAA
ncbi:hypothetical protein GCM10010430_44580 [Kitasatospora cystarginea]|uniref:DNA-binding protein n=1 Tax=Kitasatospora cystarginea TaxID=58350 RepID=A0ABN3EEM6_9ACTN